MPKTLPKCASVVAGQLPKWARTAVLAGQQVTKIFKITPSIAARWLEGNIHNRALKYGDIALYEQVMKDGDWEPTHQGIAFDPKSVLIDGQNRLWAVFNSGCTVQMQVTFNEPLKYQRVIDKVVPRSPYDTLRLAGYHWVRSNVEAGVINGFVRFGYSAHAKLSSDSLSRIANHLEEGVVYVMGKINESAKGRSMLRKVPLVVVLVRGFYSHKIKRERLAQFIEILSSGVINDRTTDTAAILLRDFILKCKDEKDAELRRSLYFRAERALEAFSKGRALRVLKPTYKELLPHPQDGEIREIITETRNIMESNRRKMKGVKPWEPGKVDDEDEDEDEQ